MKSSTVSDITSVFHGRHNCSHLECGTGKQGGRGRMSPSRGSRKRALQGWRSQGREASCTHNPLHGSHQHAQPCPPATVTLMLTHPPTHTHTCSLLPQTQTNVHKHSHPPIHPHTCTLLLSLTHKCKGTCGYQPFARHLGTLFLAAVPKTSTLGRGQGAVPSQRRRDCSAQS